MTAAETLYVNAIAGVRAAVLETQRAKEDGTLVASMLLASFERYNGSSEKTTSTWEVHAEGVSWLVENRGINQTRTSLGRAVFRKAREIIIDAAFCRDVAAPSFVITYSQAIGRDSKSGMDDQLAILEARASALWSRYSTGELVTSLHEQAWTLRQDLELWERDMASTDPACRASQGVLSKVRANMCRIIALRLAAALCERQAQQREALVEHSSQEKVDSSRIVVTELCRSVSNVLQGFAATEIEETPTMSALGLARPLYIVTKILVDESRQGISDGFLLDLLASQTRCALRMLHHLSLKAGDQCSVRMLQAIKLQYGNAELRQDQDSELGHEIDTWCSVGSGRSGQ
ncbi:hypothetical protein LTR78_004760 [Recurvomyces mirabilis]|uniref:Uncharacterized protein n=1 Tax=Recurvomyces mirabilis TaxID=574656 RepID=A0AAE0WP92_9PEZI|nr:hypothetical protein LTR78_004760 [Recurvomyces mirabilis]KAK5157931.1 hypothetical protein LTS14_003854 [Recurvomyces mirabilis]